MLGVLLLFQNLEAAGNVKIRFNISKEYNVNFISLSCPMKFHFKCRVPVFLFYQVFFCDTFQLFETVLHVSFSESIEKLVVNSHGITVLSVKRLTYRYWIARTVTSEKYDRTLYP